MAEDGTPAFEKLSDLLENQYYPESFNPSSPLELLLSSTKTHFLLLRVLVYLVHMREDPARVLFVHQVMQIILFRRQSAHEPLPRPRVVRWVFI
jgi:hypothetical protein